MNYLQKKKLAFMSIVNRVKGFVRTAVGVPPLVLPDCVGDNLINYTISGNSIQDGTPTPDNPVEIESVGEYDEATGKYKIPIKVRGKNLFDISKIIGNQNIAVNDGVVSIYKNGITAEKPYTLKDYCPNLEVGKTYIISAKHNIKYEPYQRWYLVNTKVSWSFDSISNLRTLTITQEHLDDIVVWYKDSDTESNQVWDIQVEEGAVATDYEPYQEPTKTAIYLDEPLRKVGDVSDYIDFENGKVVRNIKTQYLDPNYTSITKYTWVNKVGVYFWGYLDNVYESIPGLSNRNAEFTANTQVATSMWLGIKNKNFFWIGILDYLGFVDDDTSTAIDKFRVWIADNPTYIYYPTSTPTEEPINLPQIPTFKGTTVLSPSTTVQPSSMSATYYSTSKE